MAKFISAIELETDFTTNDQTPTLPSLSEWGLRSPKSPKSPPLTTRHTFGGSIGDDRPEPGERTRRRTFRYVVTEQLIGQRIRPRNVIMNLFVQSATRKRPVISRCLSSPYFRHFLRLSLKLNFRRINHASGTKSIRPLMKRLKVTRKKLLVKT